MFAKGGVTVQKPVKILALPRRGQDFVGGLVHRGLLKVRMDPLKVLTFPPKMTIHPQLFNISP